MKSCTSYIGSSEFRVKNTLGYVREDLTYIVIDTLEITPTSAVKSMDILNKMKVEKVSDLESSTVRVGSAEVRKMLVTTPLFECNFINNCLKVSVGKCFKSELGFRQPEGCVVLMQWYFQLNDT